MKVTCHYCGEKVSDITSDHIVPRSLGGSNAPWNRVWSCRTCNQAKDSSMPTCPCGTCKYARRRFTAAQNFKSGLGDALEVQS